MKNSLQISAAFALVLNCSLLTAQNSTLTIKKEKFNIDKVAEDQIGYTQAVKVGNTVYISGSVGWGNTEDALRHAYDVIGKTLVNYNASFQNVVKENLYAISLDSVIKFSDTRRIYYGDDFPAATWVQVDRLYSPGIIVEIEVIAVLPEEEDQK